MMNPDEDQNIMTNPALIKPPAKIDFTSGLTSNLTKSFNVPLLINTNQPQAPMQSPHLTPSKTSDRNSPLLVRPPIIIPPSFATSSSTSSSSNPYSAKGALNKKVYESVTSAPINQQSTSIFQTPMTTSENVTGVLYVPPTDTNETSLFEQKQHEIQEFMPQSQSNQESFQIDTNASSLLYQEIFDREKQQNNQQSKKAWSWLTQNKFVDKLKHSVETVITAIDPQMKNYMDQTTKHLNILNTSSERSINDSIREGLNSIGFFRVTINHYEVKPLENYAPQIVGQQMAMQAANEKMNILVKHLEQTQQPSYLILIFQDFLIEMTPNNFYDQTYISLKDTETQIEVNSFSEAIPVPSELIARVKQATPTNYALGWCGYSNRLFDTGDWYEATYGLTKRNLYSNAIKTILSIFKFKLMNFSN